MVLRHKKQGGRTGLRVILLLAAIMIVAMAFMRIGESKPAPSTSNLNVVKIEIHPEVKIQPVIVRKGTAIGGLFSTVIRKHRPYAAINGTYFDMDMRPLGDILIDGKLVNRGTYRNAVAFTKKGKVVFLHVKRGKLNWKGCASGIACGPRLIHKAKIDLDPVSEGFSRRSLTKEAIRSGVGMTADGDLLLVTSKSNLTLREFADSMLKLGAVDAINFDGGSASGLYCDGMTITTPVLPMSNMLLVYR
ncbi:MAG: phosphodiester glycosidase family protein [Armatimonadota bacterium]